MHERADVDHFVQILLPTVVVEVFFKTLNICELLLMDFCRLFGQIRKYYS